MTETMESDCFCNTSLSDPFLQGLVDHTSLQAFKHFSGARVSTKIHRLIADRKNSFRLRLLCTNADAVTIIRSNLNVFPLQIQHITNTQSCQTRERHVVELVSHKVWLPIVSTRQLSSIPSSLPLSVFLRESH